MNIIITGDIRDVANSAWVSTLDEIKTEQKTDLEVKNVVKFLIENHHTSPFECVTLTLKMNIWSEKGESDSYFGYVSDPYSKSEDEEEKVTIDLLNFLKITQRDNLWTGQAWKLFAEHRPELAELCREFKPVEDEPAPSVDELLGEHLMVVELINYHDGGGGKHDRITWRIKCPLSIAIQFQRHRTGSYNASSGRYRTVKQDFVGVPTDCQEISDKAELKIEKLFDCGNFANEEYLHFMKNAKIAKDCGKISNMEYKRLREFSRFVLPEGRLTEFYATFYLSDFLGNYKKLRDSSHAQIEHIWIAQEMNKTLKKYLDKK